MKKHLALILLAALLLAPVASQAQGVEGTLLDLAHVKDNVRSKRISSFDRSGRNNDRIENIPDGERRTLFEVDGAGMINHIWITIAPPPPTLNRNDIILRMYWDGDEAPCVEAPIGSFFGQGWDESYNFASLPLAAGPRVGRGLISYFVMPFEDGARIEVENDTGRKIDAFYYYVDYVEMDALPDDMGRLHAWYNHELTEALPDGENEWALLGPQDKNNTGGSPGRLRSMAPEPRIISTPRGRPKRSSAIPSTATDASTTTSAGWAGRTSTASTSPTRSTSTRRCGSPSNTATTTT